MQLLPPSSALWRLQNTSAGSSFASCARIGGKSSQATTSPSTASSELGVRRELTAPYLPQQNGVVERRNQTVVATARAMLKAKGLPGTFWGEAVCTTVYLLN